MYDLFKKPIICELKPSKKLACGYALIALTPIISLTTLIPKHLFIMGGLIIGIVACCIYYIRLYALRTNANSVISLRLHNGKVEIKKNNGMKQVHKIKKVSMAPEWVTFIPEKPGQKIIIDAESVDDTIYSAIRREVTTHRK